jgi:GT2 family glycosyltransferase
VQENTAMMSLVVIICTHDRSRLLDRTLSWLNAVHRPDDLAIKLFVVANACTDDTSTVLEKYSQQDTQNLPLSWVEEQKLGKSHALNSAIQLVDTDITVFVDDDHRVDSGFFTAIIRAMKEYPDTGIFCGRVIPDWDGNEPSWLHEEGRYRIYPLPVPNFDMGSRPCEITATGRIPGGGNLIMRSEVFNIAGGFNVDLGPRGRGLAGSEDTDFVLRALALNIRGQYLPDIVQFHYVDKERLKLRYILAKSYQRSRSITRLTAEKSRIPAYLWKKSALYLLKAGCSLSLTRTRFYLVRLMAVLGEMDGLRDINTGSESC